MELISKETNLENNLLNKPFRLLVGGRFISQLGDKLYLLALPWLVLELTHSAFYSSITLALEFLPQILISPFIGVYVDRKSRKWLMIIADFSRAVIVGIITFLALTNKIEMIHIYIGAFFLATITLLFDTSSEGYLPKIVSKSKLIDANANLTFINTLMRIIGPFLSGVLISLIGPEWTIGINAISFFISGLILLFLPSYKLDINSPKMVNKIFADIKEGFQYLFKHQILFPIALYSTFMNFGIYLVTTLLIFQSKEALGYGARETSIIYTVSGGVAVITTILVKVLKNYVNKGQIIRFGSIIILLAILLLIYSQSLLALTISYSLILMIGILVNVNMMAYRQEVIPSHLFGRVMTSSIVLTSSFAPVAMILSGYLAMKFSVKFVFELAAIIIFINILYAWFSKLKQLK